MAATFDSEAALCAAFLETVPEGWTAYAESCGFDIVLVHESGVQIGIEAKQRLNTKVLCQALAGLDSVYRVRGPDFRAVLVPVGGGELETIANRLGVTVLSMRTKDRAMIYRGGNTCKGSTWESRPALPAIGPFNPDRPGWMDREHWYDLAPEERLTLPEYVPDVRAGCSAPMQLSNWKIQAIKICILVEKLGSVDRATFRQLKLGMSTWSQSHWLRTSSIRGWWLAGERFPADVYRAQHPSVYAEIEADMDGWVERDGLSLTRPGAELLNAHQEALDI